MAQGPSDIILVAIRITLRIRESKVRNPEPPDRRRFVLSECSLVGLVAVIYEMFVATVSFIEFNFRPLFVYIFVSRCKGVSKSCFYQIY